MAFPAVISTATSQENSAVLTHVVSLPGSFVAGDLLLIFFRTASTNVTHSTPAGWAVLTTETGSGRTSIFYRTASGSEGPSVSITSSNTRVSASVAVSLRSSSGGFEVETAVNTIGSNLDPPSFSPSWGSADNLWIACGTARGGGGGSLSVTAAPANYTGLAVSVGSTGSTGSSSETVVALAFRNLAVSTEDPGAFTSAGNSGQHSFTIPVRESVSPSANITPPVAPISIAPQIPSVVGHRAAEVLPPTAEINIASPIPGVNFGRIYLYPSVLVNTNTFFTHEISTTQILRPTRFDNTNTFFAASIVPEALFLQPPFVPSTTQFFTHTLTSVYALSPPLLTNEQDWWWHSTGKMFYRGSVGRTGGAVSSVSFSDVPVGTLPGSTILGISLSNRNGNAIVPGTVTIDGESATIIESPVAADNWSSSAWIALAPAPVGPTATIAITLAGGTFTEAYVSVYSTHGMVLLHDSFGIAYANYGTVQSGTIDSPEGGMVVAVTAAQSAPDRSVSWSGIEEDFDSLAPGGNSTAHRADTPEWSGHSITSTLSDTSDRRALAIASFEFPPSQELEPDLLTNTNQFFTHAIETANYLYPTLFTNPNTFFTHIVGIQQFVSPPLLINSQTFFTHAVQIDNFVRPDLLINQNNFFNHTLIYEQFVEPSLFVSTNTFFTHTISTQYDLFPQTLVNQSTIFQHAIYSSLVFGYIDALLGPLVFSGSAKTTNSGVIGDIILLELSFEGESTTQTVGNKATLVATLAPLIMETPVNYYLNLHNDVEAWLEDDEVDLDDCLAGIVRRAELRLWRETKGAIGYRKVSSGTLSQETISQSIIPAERPLVVRGLQVKLPGAPHLSYLEAKDETYVKEVARTIASSRPRYYCVTSANADNMEVLVAPKPTGPATYSLEYTTLNSIVDHPDGTWLAENAYDLLFAAVRLECLRFIKDAPDNIKVEKEQYRLALEKFKIQHPARMRTSTFRSTESR